MERRHTIQKDLVLDAVQSMRSHVTAEEVYDYIKMEHPNVGKGTVYRNLSILADEKLIRRVEIPNGPDRYDFNLKDHYHVQCICCNQVFDVDMDVENKLEERIHDNHGMQFLGCDILFKGICASCQERE